MRLIIGLFLFFTPYIYADDQQDIDALLDGFHQAAANSDFDDYFSRFTDDGMFLGTDASERWTVEQFQQYAKPVRRLIRPHEVRAAPREARDQGPVHWAYYLRRAISV